MQFSMLVALFIAIAAVIFAIQNLITVHVSFIAWQFDGPLALVLLIVFAAGFLASALISAPAIVIRRLRIFGL